MRCSLRTTLFLISALFLGLVPAIAKQAEFDAAPFGRALAEKDSVGVAWPEMRRVVRLEVVFADDGSALPAPGAFEVQYWRQSWDGHAVRRYTEQGAGSTGWDASDDWTNGEWKAADSQVEISGRRATFTFNPSDLKEFAGSRQQLGFPFEPDEQREAAGSKLLGVRYRPTLKVRVKFSGTSPRVETLRAFTDSTSQGPAFLRLQFENRDHCEDPIEVYNGAFQAYEPPVTQAGVCSVQPTISWTMNATDFDADRTIVTVRSPSHPFSFAVDEVERGNRIYVKDFGVLVSRADDPITIAEYRKELQESGAKTIYDRVLEHPEQTLSGAWDDMPLKRPYFFVLGLEGGRQRFRLEPTGDLGVFVPLLPQKGSGLGPGPGTRRPGMGDGHFLWPFAMNFHFGLPGVHFAERSLAEGYLPIVTTRWLDSDLLYEEEAFAGLLTGNLNSSPPMQADDPTVAIVKFRFVNNSPQPRAAHLNFTTDATEPRGGVGRPFETLRVKDDRVVGSFEGKEPLRFLVDLRGAGRLANSSQGVTYEIELKGHQEHTMYAKVPFVSLTEDRDIAGVRALSPEREHAEVARFWAARVAAGSEIRTPEPWLNDFYKGTLTHLLINDEREIGSDRYAARVGSFDYGAFGNESIMMISDLDRRGYSKEAERSLDLFLHYQGTVPLPGNFTSQKGVLYGAGGYEMGEYNQHHGWILWGLAEHYWYSRDRAWMEHAAPHLVDACRWIIDQRKTTQKLDAKGNRVPEYGLLPAGSLEDVRDFWYWVSTNSFSWWGLDDAARALKDFGHPEGAELVRGAEDYRQDVLSAYREAAVRSPVVRLRDNTYVPDYPSNVYIRGRAYGWLRETLEGAIMLPITRLLDPNSREAQWILEDFEDNRYISDKYGYSIPVFDQFWFSRGGFSMQPNLLHGPLPYLYRDDIKNFVRAYFNPFAAGFDPTLRMLCEHPLPELGYFVGDLFKSSDESQSAYWLRLMFATELDGTLYLGRGIPRYWLKDGESIGIRSASTYFGKLSYEIRSNAKEGKIRMSLDAPARNVPREIVVRFRHPEEKPIRTVSVNGEPWQKFDAAKGDIHLPGDLKSPAAITAEY